jgi:hypothetical protein
LVATIVILVVAAIGVAFLRLSPPALAIELDPLPPMNAMQGGNFSLGISVRNSPGFFVSEAEHVQGELELPEGFIEESLQNRTRQLMFGDISSGDASHYGLTITVLNTVEVGEYHAQLAIWGENVPKIVSDIKIVVTAS